MASQQLYFVTGKGGVGKTVTSTAMALNFARDGHKTLLLELSGDSALKYYMNEQISFNPTQLEENLYVAKWTGKECLSQYVKHITGLNKLTEFFIKNNAMSSLVEIAPGLNEISILGKLTSQLRDVGIPLKYDKIVIDCFSTGHFLSLLQAPLGLNQVINMGPMGENTRQIINILKDPKICNFIIVSLAEELPYDETNELYEALNTQWHNNIKVILNKVNTPISLIPTNDDEKKIKSYFVKKEELQSKWVKKYRDKFKQIYTCPFVFKTKPKVLIENIANGLTYE